MDDVRPAGSSLAPRVTWREIAKTDFEELLAVLGKGFPPSRGTIMSARSID